MATRPGREDDAHGQGSAAWQHGPKSLSGRRRRKHGVGWQPMLAVEARGTRDSGAIDASGQRHERRELAHVPLWPVAAVVGSELSGIRIRIEASVNRACKLHTSSLAGPVAGLHNWFLLRRVRTRRLAATCEE